MRAARLVMFVPVELAAAVFLLMCGEGAMACGQRRLALQLHAESIEAEERASDDNLAWGDASIIPPAVTPPLHPHSPGKLNRHASLFPSSPGAW